MAISTITLLQLTFLATFAVVHAQTTFTANMQRSTAITAIDHCKRKLFVQNSFTIQSNTRVLLYQVFDSRSQPIGLCEWAIVDTVIDNAVFLRSSINDSFVAEYGAQLVLPLNASHGVVADTFLVNPWNGYNGGVAVFVCSDTFEIRAPIQSRNAQRPTHQQLLNTRDTSTTTSLWFSVDGGPRNAGGAGGTGGGSGGRGGNQTDVFVASATGGVPLPVPALDSTVCQIPLGGFAGMGHQNDRAATAGGSSGGVVIVDSPILVSRGGVISTSGNTAPTAYGDGAGGGGAGGSIWISAHHIDGPITLASSGGNGGNTVGILGRYGAGGGGGGGLVLHRATGSISYELSGGQAGIAVTTTDNTPSSHGAQDGDDGRSSRWHPIPIGEVHRTRVAIERVGWDFDADAAIVAVKGAKHVRWLTAVHMANERGDTVLVSSNAGLYAVAVLTTDNGCTVLDSVRIQRPTGQSILTVSMNNASGRPGDTVDLFLQVRCEPQSSAEIIGVAYCSMRATTLIPVRGSVRRDDSTIQKVIPFRLQQRRSSTFRREQAAVALGDSLSVQLRIDSVRLESDPIPIRTVSGRFTLEDVCISGRPRLLSPLESGILVRGRSVEVEADNLHIVDVTGRTISAQIITTGTKLVATIDAGVRGAVFVTATRGGTTATKSIILD